MYKCRNVGKYTTWSRIRTRMIAFVILRPLPRQHWAATVQIIGVSELNKKKFLNTLLEPELFPYLHIRGTQFL